MHSGSASMTEHIQYLSVDEAIAIHDRVIDAYGGKPGLRDPGLLEAALFRPQTGCYEDLAAMAASLFDALLFNHAFHAGNRRVAFFATDVFLRLNGWKFDVDAGAASRFLADLAEGGHAQRAALLPLVRRTIVEDR